MKEKTNKETFDLFYFRGFPISLDNVNELKHRLRKLGFVGSPANERRILNLYYSLDSLNWFEAGTVAMSRNPLESFSYPSMLIDGEDLLVLSRTSLGGKNQHDTNHPELIDRSIEVSFPS